MKGNRRRSTDYSSPYRKGIEERSCLKCGRAFLSESQFNRICYECGRENEKMGNSVTISEKLEIETEYYRS